MRFVLYIILSLISFSLFSQPSKKKRGKKDIGIDMPDSIRNIKEFVRISSGFSRIPLRLQMTVKRTSDFSVDNEDTGSHNAFIGYDPAATYISYDQYEQLANDSLLVMVDHRMKRMMVSKNERSVESQLAFVKNIVKGDTAVMQLASLFNSTIYKVNDTLSVIILESKEKLRLTDSIWKQQIIVSYNPVLQIPVTIVQSEHQLFPIGKDQYNEWTNNKQISGKLLSEQENYYVVTQNKVECSFTPVPLANKIPLITDRVVINGLTKIQPQQKYAGYRIDTFF